MPWALPLRLDYAGLKNSNKPGYCFGSWEIPVEHLDMQRKFPHLLHLEVYGSNKVNEQFGGSSGEQRFFYRHKDLSGG